MKKDKEPFIEISEFDSAKPRVTKPFTKEDFRAETSAHATYNIVTKPFTKEDFFSPNVKAKPKEATEDHFKIVNWISIGFCLVFLLLVLIGKEMPDYFIGFVGSILGYFISKKPWEITSNQ